MSIARHKAEILSETDMIRISETLDPLIPKTVIGSVSPA